jgi:hypothetical protein
MLLGQTVNKTKQQQTKQTTNTNVHVMYHFVLEHQPSLLAVEEATHCHHETH